MTLAQALSEAKGRELSGLAKYIASELTMEVLDLGEDTQVAIQPDAIENILKAWAFTQQNARDGMD